MDAAALALLAGLPAPDGTIPILDAARTAAPGAALDDVLAAAAISTGSATPSAAKRNRLAQLVLGTVAEQEFEQRYRAAMQGQDFGFEDQSSAGTETDFLVLNGKGRRAFRINIKAHGTFFKEAQKFVGLAPEDTFALATYKIKDANRKSKDEALPFLFAVVSSEDLGSGGIASNLPPEVAYLADSLSLYKGIKGLRAIENALVATMLDPNGYGTSPLVVSLRQAVQAATWRVISAVKADHLLTTLMWERVPAVSKRTNLGGNQSQPNMHFSLSGDMIPLDELLVLLRDHGIQHVATKIAYHEI